MLPTWPWKRRPAARRSPAVGDQRAGAAEAPALQVAGRVQHLLHAGAAARALVPDDHDVARADRAAQYPLDRVLLALEDLGRPGELVQFPRHARGLHDRAVRRE